MATVSIPVETMIASARWRKTKDGSDKPSASAPVVAKWLSKIADESPDRGVRTEQILEHAEDDASPIHDLLEWDDTKAAHQHRLHQVRGIVNRLELEVITDTGDTQRQRMFVSVATGPGAARTYYASAETMTDEELRRKAIATAIKELQAWARRHAQYAELSPVVKAIDKLAA